MVKAQCRSVLLSVLVLSCVACETDVDLDFLSEGSSIIVTCLAAEGEPLVVSATSSVAYSDTSRYRALGEAQVVVLQSGGEPRERALEEGDCQVFFPEVVPREGDSLFIEVHTEDGMASCGFRMPSRVDILDLDTVRTDGNSVSMVLSLRDSVGTYDCYQVKVVERLYSAGSYEEVEPQVDYTHYLFNVVSSVIGVKSQPRGYFDDTNMRGATVSLTFSVTGGVVDAEALGVDSVGIAARLYHHSSDYYYYQLTASQSGRYFLLPVFGSAGVHFNVEGGYGIAAGMVYDEREFIVSRDSSLSVAAPQSSL